MQLWISVCFSLVHQSQRLFFLYLVRSLSSRCVSVYLYAPWFSLFLRAILLINPATLIAPGARLRSAYETGTTTTTTVVQCGVRLHMPFPLSLSISLVCSVFVSLRLNYANDAMHCTYIIIIYTYIYRYICMCIVLSLWREINSLTIVIWYRIIFIIEMKRNKISYIYIFFF